MAEPVIHAWQWALSDLRQHAHRHDGVLVRLRVREADALRVEPRLGGAGGSAPPLQPTVSLQPLVAHPGEQRGERRDFAHDLARMLVMPPRAETVRDLLDDLPVRSAALERLE